MNKELQIRNSTVDFLVFTRDAGEDGIEVRVQNGDVWLTQKAISQLFDVDRSVVTKHLSNIFKEGELDENSTCANFAQVADNGKTYNYSVYLLPRNDAHMEKMTLLIPIFCCNHYFFGLTLTNG